MEGQFETFSRAVREFKVALQGELMGILDWVKSKVKRDVRDVPEPKQSVSEPAARAVRTMKARTSGLPGYDSKHGKARGLRYWHRHLSPAARGRKRTLRRIRRESRRYNR